MKSGYSFERRNGYLYMEITGEYDREDFLVYPKIILDECKKEELYLVLVNGLDLKMQEISTMGRFFLGEKINSVLKQEVKLAAVWLPKYSSQISMVMTANPGVNIYMTTSVEMAEKWLVGRE